jgi:hypothetical protein
MPGLDWTKVQLEPGYLLLATHNCKQGELRTIVLHMSRQVSVQFDAVIITQASHE